MKECKCHCHEGFYKGNWCSKCPCQERDIRLTQEEIDLIKKKYSHKHD